MNTLKIRELNKKIRENKELMDERSRKSSFVERRSGLKDRRKVHTYLADDRRCGIADRRKKTIPAWYHDYILQKYKYLQQIGTFWTLKNLAIFIRYL